MNFKSDKLCVQPDPFCENKGAEENKEVLLSVRELCVKARESENQKMLLDNLSFSLRRGEVLALVGETGSGKTMTAKAIMGMLNANLSVEGRIVLEGQNLLDLNAQEMHALRGRKIGMAFQNPETALNPLLKNGNQLNLIMGKNESDQVRRLRSFGLCDKRILKQYPFELSGGMAQRFMASLSLGHGVEMVIFDEPTRGLDPDNRNLLAELILLLSKKRHVAILLLTHDMGLIERVADRCIVLQDGKIVEHGSVDTILHHPTSSYMKGIRDEDPRFQRILPLLDLEEKKQEETPILELRDIHCSYALNPFSKERHQVLHELNMSVFQGEILGLIGASGCGKSTLASCILGLLNYQGEIFFSGKLLKMRGRPQIGHICQSATSSFDPARTIRQSLEEVFLVHPEYALPGEKENQIHNVLKVVDLYHLLARLDSYPHEFSGGQLQRFAIARTLLSQVKFIILDEVTSMLDLKTQASIIRLLARLRKERGLTYIFITHDLPLAQQFCDRILQMKDGCVRNCLE